MKKTVQEQSLNSTARSSKMCLLRAYKCGLFYQSCNKRQHIVPSYTDCDHYCTDQIMIIDKPYIFCFFVCKTIYLLFPRVWILSLNERFKWTKICRKSVASFKMVNITFLQYNWCFLLNNLCHFRVWYTNIFFSSLLILVHKPKIYH